VKTHYQIFLAIVGPEDMEIALGKPGIAEALRHGLGRRGDVADRIGGVDFDQLLEEVV
jgi:hypothetical protein